MSATLPQSSTDTSQVSSVQHLTTTHTTSSSSTAPCTGVVSNIDLYICINYYLRKNGYQFRIVCLYRYGCYIDTSNSLQDETKAPSPVSAKLRGAKNMPESHLLINEIYHNSSDVKFLPCDHLPRSPPQCLQNLEVQKTCQKATC